MARAQIAIVLAAGLGTRLKPLTEFFPKTGLPIKNLPVAYHLISQFLRRGFREVHCNVHYKHLYLMEEIKHALRRDGYLEEAVRFWYEPELLESGGTILNIANELFKETKNVQDVVVASGDIYATFPFEGMMPLWKSKQPDQAILLSTRAIPEGVERKDAAAVDKELRFISGFGLSQLPNQIRPTDHRRLFTTFQILDGDFLLSLENCPGPVRENVFNQALKRGKKILNHCFEEKGNLNQWFDIGTLNDYRECLSASDGGRAQHCYAEVFYRNDSLSNLITQSGVAPGQLRQMSVEAQEILRQTGAFCFVLNKHSLSHSSYSEMLPVFLEASFFGVRDEGRGGGLSKLIFKFEKD